MAGGSSVSLSRSLITEYPSAVFDWGDTALPRPGGSSSGSSSVAGRLDLLVMFNNSNAAAGVITPSLQRLSAPTNLASNAFIAVGAGPAWSFHLAGTGWVGLGVG